MERIRSTEAEHFIFAALTDGNFCFVCLRSLQKIQAVLIKMYYEGILIINSVKVASKKDFMKVLLYAGEEKRIFKNDGKNSSGVFL